jgi:DNA-directed RNA polymerase subunit RPC12/RpoP
MTAESINKVWNGLSVTIAKIEPGGSPDYLTERTGRCHNCKARFIWPTKLGKLKNSKCPFCGSQLYLTSYMWQGDTYRIDKKIAHIRSPRTKRRGRREAE